MVNPTVNHWMLFLHISGGGGKKGPTKLHVGNVHVFYLM